MLQNNHISLGENNLDENNMSADQIDFLCEHCGQTLSAFLHEMAERNAKVVCPNCGESRDSTNEKSERFPTVSHPATTEHRTTD
jgi:predicted RNA-binding Zn-ribbon protein involved in translation (DUF1610 family)